VQDTALEYIFRMSTGAAPEQKRQNGPAISAVKRDELPIQGGMKSSVTAPEPAKATGVMPMPTHSHSASPVTVDKIGRNDPCYCGSGKKYKKCHGK
jgi:uncharacterized protein YecA (UPF0149 family)